MTPERNRYRLLAGATLCLLVVAVLGLLFTTGVHQLDRIDNELGRGPQSWTLRHRTAEHVWLAVEAVFSTVPMTVYTLVTAALLTWRKHVRAAVWTVVVMLGSSLSTYFLKGVVGRDRPVWPTRSTRCRATPSRPATPPVSPRRPA